MTKTFNCLCAEKRLSAAAYLDQWGSALFPPCFEAVLHPFFVALLPMDADERVAATLGAFPQFLRIMQPAQQQQQRDVGSGMQHNSPAEGPVGERNRIAEAACASSFHQSAADMKAVAGGLGTQLSSVAGPATQV